MNQDWPWFFRIFNPAKAFGLATIIDTEGSTYRKTGTMILVDEHQCYGLVSGGCLEEDIRLRTQTAIRDNQQVTMRYDLTDTEESLLSFGLGCEGVVTILIQPLTPENQHLGFAEVLANINQGNHFYLLQCYETGEAKPLIIQPDIADFKELPRSSYRQLNVLKPLRITEEQCLLHQVRPPLKLLICGAGPDALPLVSFCKQLGWQPCVWDHREAYLAQHQSAIQRRKMRASGVELDDLAEFDAAVVMTHNLQHDQEYLSKLLATGINYIGLLGPPHRKQKLFDALSINEKDVEGKVFGPVGIDINCNTPESIALSIVAQIQQQVVGQWR